MAYNGVGQFLINSSGQPVVTGTTIASTVFNALTADLGVGLSTCILKDGTQATTARIPFIFGINSSLTTDSSSVGTGSIITSGGIGVTKALWIGGLANIAGAVTLQSTLAVTGAVTLTSTLASAALTATTGTFTSALQSTSYLSTSSVIYLGGTTSSEVRFIRTSTTIEAQLGDGSDYASLNAGNILTTSGILLFTGSTSSDVRVRNAGAALLVRLGDDSDYAQLNASNLLSTAGKVYLTGTSVNDVLLKNTSNFTVTIRKGDDSANGNLTCGTLTPTLLNYSFGGISSTFDPNAKSSMTFLDGLLTNVS